MGGSRHFRNPLFDFKTIERTANRKWIIQCALFFFLLGIMRVLKVAIRTPKSMAQRGCPQCATKIYKAMLSDLRKLSMALFGAE
jgi:hypothetical protein